MSLEGLILWFELLLDRFLRIALRFCFFLVDNVVALAACQGYVLFSDIPGRDFDGINLQYIARLKSSTKSSHFLRFNGEAEVQQINALKY